MNTGSPQILHATRWQRFGRTINGLVADLDRPWDGEETAPQLAIRPEEEEEILQSLRGLGYVE